MHAGSAHLAVSLPVTIWQPPDNRNRAWFGFAEKRLKSGEHHLQALAKFEKEETPVLLAEIEACKSRSAALAHRPVSAVHISIDY